MEKFTPIIVDAPQRSDIWYAKRLGNVTASKAKDTMAYYAVTATHLKKADEYYDLNKSSYSSDWLSAMRDNFPTEYCLHAGVHIQETATRSAYRENIVSERITGLRSDEDGYVNSAMRWGIINERDAIEIYQDKFNTIVEEAPLMLHPELLCGASSDGLVIDKSTGELGNAEVKCLTTRNHLYKVMKNESMPEEFYPQVQMQMWISGRSWCDFIAYDSRPEDGLQLFVKRIEFDSFYVENVLEPMLRRFLEECDRDEKQFIAIMLKNKEK